MPYDLRTILIAEAPILEIDDAQGKEIIRAWKSATITARIEDLWDNVIQSYIELESDMLQVAVRDMVISFDSYDDLQQLRLQFGRRLSAYLHFAKAYVEQTCASLEDLADRKHLRCFRHLTAKAKADENYRFMYSLRNFTQHNGLAVHGATLDNSWSLLEQNGRKEKGTQRYSARATIGLGIVRQGRTFDHSAFRELPDDHHVDVITVARSYMEKLSNIHAGLRESMEESFAAWKVTIRSVLRRYELQYGDDPRALRLEWSGELRSGTSEVNLFDEMLIRTETMIRKNRELINLPKRYVSSALK